MENKKRQLIKYQFFRFDNPNGTPLNLNTLNLERPAEVRFLFTSPLPGTYCIINQTYVLAPLNDFISGITNAPYELILKNNLQEIDITNYQINILNVGTLFVTCKYYIDN